MRRGAFVLLLMLIGCSSAKPAMITGREWQVVAIDTLLAPVGAGGRPITLRFDDSTKRLYGFAGCNQYNANYTLTGDSLSLGAALSTRMSCAEFDEVEQQFLSSLALMTHAKSDGKLLVLSGNGKAIRAQ